MRNIIKEWIEALRSGKYIQTQGNLRCEDGFCCLGVLGDLINPDAWDKYENYINDSEGVQVHYGSYLPSCILALKTQRNLAGINDGNTGFGIVADEIEKLDKAGEIEVNIP